MTWVTALQIAATSMRQPGLFSSHIDDVQTAVKELCASGKWKSAARFLSDEVRPRAPRGVPQHLVWSVLTCAQEHGAPPKYVDRLLSSMVGTEQRGIDVELYRIALLPRKALAEWSTTLRTFRQLSVEQPRRAPPAPALNVCLAVVDTHAQPLWSEALATVACDRRLASVATRTRAVHQSALRLARHGGWQQVLAVWVASAPVYTNRVTVLGLLAESDRHREMVSLLDWVVKQDRVNGGTVSGLQLRTLMLLPSPNWESAVSRYVEACNRYSYVITARDRLALAQAFSRGVLTRVESVPPIQVLVSLSGGNTAALSSHRSTRETVPYPGSETDPSPGDAALTVLAEPEDGELEVVPAGERTKGIEVRQRLANAVEDATPIFHLPPALRRELEAVLDRQGTVIDDGLSPWHPDGGDEVVARAEVNANVYIENCARVQHVPRVLDMWNKLMRSGRRTTPRALKAMLACFINLDLWVSATHVLSSLVATARRDPSLAPTCAPGSATVSAAINVLAAAGRWQEVLRLEALCTDDSTCARWWNPTLPENQVVLYRALNTSSMYSLARERAASDRAAMSDPAIAAEVVRAAALDVSWGSALETYSHAKATGCHMPPSTFFEAISACSGALPVSTWRMACRAYSHLEGTERSAASLLGVLRAMPSTKWRLALSAQVVDTACSTTDVALARSFVSLFPSEVLVSLTATRTDNRAVTTTDTFFTATADELLRRGLVPTACRVVAAMQERGFSPGVALCRSLPKAVLAWRAQNAPGYAHKIAVKFPEMSLPIWSLGFEAWSKTRKAAGKSKPRSYCPYSLFGLQKLRYDASAQGACWLDDDRAPSVAMCSLKALATSQRPPKLRRADPCIVARTSSTAVALMPAGWKYNTAIQILDSLRASGGDANWHALSIAQTTTEAQKADTMAAVLSSYSGPALFVRRHSALHHLSTRQLNITYRFLVLCESPPGRSFEGTEWLGPFRDSHGARCLFVSDLETHLTVGLELTLKSSGAAADIGEELARVVSSLGLQPLTTESELHVQNMKRNKTTGNVSTTRRHDDVPDNHRMEETCVALLELRFLKTVVEVTPPKAMQWLIDAHVANKK
eukprot:PhM_4_TR5946/c0_g1_i1/m.1048